MIEFGRPVDEPSSIILNFPKPHRSKILRSTARTTIHTLNAPNYKDLQHGQRIILSLLQTTKLYSTDKESYCRRSKLQRSTARIRNHTLAAPKCIDLQHKTKDSHRVCCSEVSVKCFTESLYIFT